MVKRMALQLVIGLLLGATLYTLRPKPEPVYGVRGADGYRTNLFRGVLPPATEVTK